jgi:hydrogenase maturation protease
MRTLVLALGNPLRGDDGVGAAVLERLADASLPEDTVLLEGGTPGLETVLLLQGYQRVLIIDAAEMGRDAGDWQRFRPDQVRLQARDLYLRGTLHYAGLAEALNLADALNLLPPTIEIFGIQPQEIGWEAGLSEAVRAAVPVVCEAVLERLTYGEDSDH